LDGISLKTLYFLLQSLSYSRSRRERSERGGLMEGNYGTYKAESLLAFVYLVSGVDSGPCLEELPHHTGVATGGCSHHCSVPIL